MKKDNSSSNKNPTITPEEFGDFIFYCRTAKDAGKDKFTFKGKVYPVKYAENLIEYISKNKK